MGGVLQIQNVTKSYGKLRVVDDVSIILERGDNLAIIGESGCGKTTLAKMMMGLIMPDKGSIKAEAYSLQMVFQDPNQSLDPLWDVRAILMEGLTLHKCNLSAISVQEKLEHILAAVGLGPQALQRFPHEFSGGERQRIAIARAILAAPQVLVLDEAVSALDTLVQKQTIDLLRKLKKDFNLSYIFISHNLRLVRQFSDKILVMRQGKIVEEGQVRSVFENPTHFYTRQLVEASFYKGQGLGVRD